MTRYFWSLGMIVLAGTIALGGCARQQASTPSTTNEPTGQVAGRQETATPVTVTVNDAGVTVSPNSVPMGTATVTIRNEGSKPQAFTITGSGVNQKTNTLNPGESTTVTVNNLQQGTYTVTPTAGTMGRPQTLTITQAAAGSRTTTTRVRGTITDNGIEITPSSAPAGRVTMSVRNGTSMDQQITVSGNGVSPTTRTVRAGQTANVELPNLQAGSYEIAASPRAAGGTGAQPQGGSFTVTGMGAGGTGGTGGATSTPATGGGTGGAAPTTGGGATTTPAGGTTQPTSGTR